MSDTNRTALRIVEEIENGVIPANPAFLEVRNTGAPGFGINPTTVESDEIRPDRQVADIISVGSEPGGDVNMELSYGAFDNIFEGAFQKYWKEQPTSSKGDIASVEGSQITFNSEKNIFKAGDYILFSYAYDAEGNNLLVSVTESDAEVLTVSIDVSSIEGIKESSVKRVGIKADSGDIQIDVGAENKLVSTTLDFTSLGLEAGMWIKLGDNSSSANQFSTLENNDAVRILDVVDEHHITLSNVPKGFATDDGAGKEIIIYMGDFLKNAEKNIDPTRTDPILSYTLEQVFLDHKPIDYQYFSGMIPDTLSMTLNAASIIDMSTSFLGATAKIVQTRESGATDITAPQYPVMNTSSNVARIARGGSKIQGANYVSELTVEINNNCRRRNAVGIYGTESIGLGEFAVTGNMNTYFSNADLLQDLINNEETSLNYMVKDNKKHAYIFDMPRVKYSSGNPDVSGKNEDVMLSLDYQAIRDPNLGYTLGITRFDYIN